MSNIFFERKAKVVVTDEVLNISEELEADDNRIVFSVQKNINSLPNIANISIYNPDSDFSNFSSKENLKIDLYVSYFDEEPELLFTGDLKRSYFVNKDVDNIFIIEAGDSEKNITETFINKTYIKGVKKKTIIQDCIKLLKVDVITSSLDKITGSYNGGFVCFNKVVDILDIVILSLDLEYSIQDNQFFILKKGEINEIDSIDINYDDGLLAKPTPLQDGGFMLRCLLNPKYTIHKTISLETEDYEGFFQIRQMDFTGDTTNKKWEVNLICQ